MRLLKAKLGVVLLFILFHTIFARKIKCKYGYSGKNCADSIIIYFILKVNLNFMYYLSLKECGVTYKNPNTKIVGGIEAEPNSWPSIVYVVSSYTFDYELPNPSKEIQTLIFESYCAGVLIDRYTVLTAAHCYRGKVSVKDPISGNEIEFNVTTNKFHKTIGSIYSVYVGVHDIEKDGVKINVSEYIKHPLYDKSSVLNDIAIIKLATPVKLNKKVQLACLPRMGNPRYPIRTNINTWAPGWGFHAEGQRGSSKLYNVKMTLYGSKKCNNTHTSFPKDWNKQICAGIFF